MASRQNQPGRPARPGRSIRGPQSALTDFLAAQGISANQIRSDAEARRRAAAPEAEQNGIDGTDSQQDAGAPAFTAVTSVATTRVTASAQVTRRTRRSNAQDEPRAEEDTRKSSGNKAIEKIKTSKRLQKRKRHLDGDEHGDDFAPALFNERSTILPGQMANCEICDKRFTVTPYSRQGPNGGLVCNPCGKELDKDGPPTKKPAKKPTAGPVGRRRKVQSSILDGTYTHGAKSLVALCLDVLTKNIDLADDLGDLPPIIIDKVARKLSKHRLLDSRTIDLFITPATEDVHVYDGGKLGLDDYIRIFQVAPRIKNLKVRNGVQFKDEVMDFLLGRDIQLESLYLHGANLLSDEKWQEFLRKRGKSLRKLQVYYTDNHFGDDTLALLATACPNLKRLKVKFNQKVTGKGIKEIAKIETLEHLGIHLSDPSGQRDYVHPDCYVYLINKVGSRLRTFSVTNNEDLDNTVLDALRNNARRLEKLRITDSRVMTDDGFARLFTGWQNPGLAFLDLQRNRHVDASKPAENRASIGLCSDGFRALMAHSGRTLRDLNVHADRHITAAAFEDVFAEHRTYPEMKRLEISFCDQVTDFIVGCAFRSCPNLRALNVFGCMRVRDVMVPRGKLLVGVPNAQGMVMEG